MTNPLNPYSMRGNRTAALLTRNEMSNFLKRGRKTSRDQVEMYVHFLEKNPTVAMARSNPNNNTMLSSLWEELTFRLNSSDQGPLKSLQQWQETFANWRYQLRFKTRKMIQRQEDGLDLLELSDLEERALRVLTSCNTFNESDQVQNSSYTMSPSNRIPRRKFTRKRSRSSTPSQNRRATRNSMSADSTSSQIFEPPNDPVSDPNSFYEYFEHDQKPIIVHEPNATDNTPVVTNTSSSSQTDGEISENNAKVSSSDNNKKDLQVQAINKLERAVNSLNDTLKRLVQVQTDMLSVMNRR